MTAPIHYRGSIGEQVILMQNFSKSVPMKSQTHYKYYLNVSILF